MIYVHQNGALSPFWVLHSLSPENNLCMHTILFQLTLVSNPILLQLFTCNVRGWMSLRSGITTCILTWKLGYVGWYSWGSKKNTGELRLFIARNDWRVSWYFRSLYIASILWNIIKASLGSLCEACVLLNLNIFINPLRVLMFCSSWSSYFLFIHLITSRKNLTEVLHRML